MAIAALVLGIISLVFACTPIAFIAPIVGVVGIVLGAIARKNGKAANQPTGAATAGLVMSIIGVVLGAIIWLACMACTHAASKVGEEVLKNDKELQKAVESLKDDKELKKAMEDLEKAAKEAE